MSFDEEGSETAPAAATSDIDERQEAEGETDGDVVGHEPAGESREANVPVDGGAEEPAGESREANVPVDGGVEEPAGESREEGLGAQDVEGGSEERPWLSEVVSALLLLMAEGAGLAGGVQLGWYRKRVPELVRDNVMALSDRWTMMLSMVGVGGLLCAIAIAYLLYARSRVAVKQVTACARAGAPAMLVFGGPLLFNWRVFQDWPLTCVVTATLYGLVAERVFRTSFSAIPWATLRERFRRGLELVARYERWFVPVLVGAGFLSFAIYFSYYTIMHHLRLQTQSLDMAIFNNMMWNLARGEWFKSSPILGPGEGAHIQYHATFDAYLFLPIYVLYQKPQMLQIIQATVCGLGSIPLYLLVRRRLESRWIALAFAYCYLIYAPQHAAMFYDFHFLTLAPAFVLWALYAFERGSRVGLAIAWGLALLLREDIAASMSLAALFYLLSGKRPWVALGAGFASALYFVAAKFLIMPAHQVGGGGSETFTYVFKELIPPEEKGFAAVLRTVATNPVFALVKMFQEKKVVYVLSMLGPVLLLPLRSRRAWIFMAFPAAFALLSTGYNPVIQTTFQYTALWTSYAFIAAAWSLHDWRPARDGGVRIAAAVCAMVLAGTAFSYNFGGIFQHHTFRGGFRKVAFERTEEERQRLADLYTLIDMIPPTASVAASETEAPHLSSRPDVYTIRLAFHDAEYLLINIQEVRTNFCRAGAVRAFRTGRYGFVTRQGGFTLWKRDAPKDRNAEGFKILGLKNPP